MAKKKIEKVVTVRFTVPSFRSKGVEYKSAEVEAAAQAGDVEAQELIKMLLEKGSGVIEIVEEDAEKVASDEAEEAAKAAEAKAAAKVAAAEAKAEQKKRSLNLKNKSDGI